MYLDWGCRQKETEPAVCKLEGRVCGIEQSECFFFEGTEMLLSPAWRSVTQIYGSKGL